MTDQYEAVATNVGKFIVPVALLLWGMSAAHTRSLVRGANLSALRSLEFALGAWVVLLLQGAFAPMLPWQATAAAMAVLFGLALWASGLGVTGLLQVRQRQSGLVPALGGLLIGLGLAGLASWGIVLGYLSTQQQTAQPAAPAELAEFGFSVLPPSEWEPVDPQQINPEARLAYLRIKSAMAFLVMAENAPPEQSFDTRSVVENVRSSLGVTSSTVVRDKELSVGGRPGVLLEIDAAGPLEEFNYSVWLSVTNFQAIIAMVSAKTTDATPAELAAEATRIFGTMHFRSP